jgi:hypothetical protein
MNFIGDNHVHIEYGSPSVRGRKIWGGLVAYNQVWATGAHKASWIEFSSDVMIGTQIVPKGRYGFFTIPGKKKWTLILNTVWDMHLADDYDEKNDLLRWSVKPKKTKSFTEALSYEVLEVGATGGNIQIKWDMLEVQLPFKNKI